MNNMSLPINIFVIIIFSIGFLTGILNNIFMYKLFKQENLTKNFFSFMGQINFDKEIKKILWKVALFRNIDEFKNNKLLKITRINFVIFYICFFSLWFGTIIVIILKNVKL